MSTIKIYPFQLWDEARMANGWERRLALYHLELNWDFRFHSNFTFFFRV